MGVQWVVVVVVVVVVVPPLELALTDAPDSPVSTEPGQPARAGAAATTRPRSIAPAVRGRVPSALRSGAPQWGQAISVGRAWQEHEGQATSVSKGFMRPMLIAARPRVNRPSGARD